MIATRRVALFSILYLAAGLAPLLATTFFVRPDGSDGNTGFADSDASAFATIQRGVDALTAGDELVVGDGTYVIADKIIVTGLMSTSTTPTVIRAANRWQALLRFAGQYGTFVIEDSQHLIVEGLDVGPTHNRTTTHLGTGIESFRSDYVVFRDNHVHDCGCGGVSFREGDYVTIERNVTTRNAKNSNFNCSGISIYQPRQLDQAAGFHLVVQQNVSFANECNLPFTPGGFTRPTDGNGIILDDFENVQNNPNPAFKAASLVVNNVAFDNGGAGVKVYGSDNATIRHNSTYHNLRILRNYVDVPGESLSPIRRPIRREQQCSREPRRRPSSCFRTRQ